MSATVTPLTFATPPVYIHQPVLITPSSRRLTLSLNDDCLRRDIADCHSLKSLILEVLTQVGMKQRVSRSRGTEDVERVRAVRTRWQSRLGRRERVDGLRERKHRRKELHIQLISR